MQQSRPQGQHDAEEPDDDAEKRHGDGTLLRRRFVAIGDSFTEGVGDDLDGGRVRGWADLVAVGLARADQATIGYANLAIRGRKLAPIVSEQLEAAIALGPTLMSINGGGNDIMRPRVSIGQVSGELERATDRALERGIAVLLVSGADPSAHLPLGSLVSRRGGQLADAVRGWARKPGVAFADNWADATLRDIRYWSPDRLHLNALGHTRAAGNALAALGLEVPSEWGIEVVADAASGPDSGRTAAYYRHYVLPWLGRRLTGRSSGDGREPKFASFEPVEPRRGG